MTHPLNIVVLGLSLSSAWGNGHATTYRALLKALAARGHSVLFLERDVPWFAAHRDLPEPPDCRFALYGAVEELHGWKEEIAAADAVIVGSFVPDGIAVGHLVRRVARGLVAFYDIDTPVTVAMLEDDACAYLARDQVAQYDIYLSFSGGRLLDALPARYGSPMAVPLYCSVDEALHRPMPDEPLRWDLSYLGTYSKDRQPTLERLLIEVARQAPDRRFAVAGAQYPQDIAWPANVERLEHVAPGDHPRFYAASRFTLNVTRAEMVRAGWSPSVRLFEAAACGTPVISDRWEGLEAFFEPGEEILLPAGTVDVLALLSACDGPRRAALAQRARARVLRAHTAAHRARELEEHLGTAMRNRQAKGAVRAGVAA